MLGGVPVAPLISKLLRAPGEVLSGRTNEDRKHDFGDEPGFELIEKKQALLPVNGLPLVTGARGRKGGHRAGGRGRRGPSLPPTIECTPALSHRYRYFANATATNANVTVGNLLGAMGGICTVANSTISSICSSVRVKRVSIYSGVVSTGAVNAELTWFAGGSSFTKDDSKESSVPEGITMERVLVTRPPAKALASFWQNSASVSNVLFQITCQGGSLIDVEMVGTLGNNLSNVAITGYSTATLATVYYGRLDGVGGKFQPLGVPTTN